MKYHNTWIYYKTWNNMSVIIWNLMTHEYILEMYMYHICENINYNDMNILDIRMYDISEWMLIYEI